jgi:response regulator RpfG family c-di-GMP phosphodiesterase
LNRNFLIVAASGQVRERLARDLRAQGYSVTLAASAAEAERVVRSVAVDAVLVESHLPDGAAADLSATLKRHRPECRVAVVTSFGQVRNTPEQLRFGNDDFLLHANQVANLLRAPFEAAQDSDAGIFGRRSNEALIQVIDVLVGLRELDETVFSVSSHQAMRLTRAMTEEMSSDEQAVQEVILATLLRDIGNAGIAAETLDESGSFSEEQLERRQEHVQSTLRILEHIDFPWKISPVIRHQHECYDGSGGPDGLRGREIPMGARVLAVVDCYLALTSDRRSAGAMEPEQALKELIRRSGHEFDPEVVEVFQRVLDKRFAGRRARRKPRVLVGEPQDDYRKLLKMRLANEGYEVREATSNEQTLELILKHRPDLVLADLDAAPSETFQLLRELREDESLSRTPFAMLSQRSDRVLKLRALREGVDDYLSKTTDMEEIVAHVDNILTREAIRDGRARKSRRGISGDLNELSLPDLVQTLVIGMKTARVSVTSNGHAGSIWFEAGTPKHAETGDAEGDDAFYEMVRWRSGEFVIEHGVTVEKTSLQHDAMYLLMEGLRLMDEDEAQSGVAS